MRFLLSLSVSPCTECLTFKTVVDVTVIVVIALAFMSLALLKYPAIPLILEGLLLLVSASVNQFWELYLLDVMQILLFVFDFSLVLLVLVAVMLLISLLSMRYVVAFCFRTDCALRETPSSLIKSFIFYIQVRCLR